MERFIKTDYIDLKASLFCGQAFRWKEIEEGVYRGGSGDKFATIKANKEGLTLVDVPLKDVPYWENYFCLNEDYPLLIKRFSEDETLKKACALYPGLRVLKQEPFEALISFIISQCNNIGRITGIINRLCECFGENLGENHAFPKAEDLTRLSEADLSVIRAGYRAEYILDASKKIINGEIRLDEIAKAPYNESKRELLKIKGVGEKVADCALLYGFHKTEAFPKDVWIKRVLAEYYPDGLPECIKGFEGIAQMFLFHYIRNLRK